MEINTTGEYGLNATLFAQARKDMMMGKLTALQWGKCSADQRKILHQIELTVKSFNEDE